VKNKKLFSVISTVMLLVLLTLMACDDGGGGGGTSDLNLPVIIGTITGTITLTDVPSPKPKSVSISVSGFDNVTYDYWSSYDSRINITGSGTLSNISWSIPIYEDDDFFPSTGNFSLWIELTNNNSFSIDIPTTKTISSVNANVGSLGTVSLKTITLSGTINVTCNGQVVPYVEIMASASSTSAYGYTTLTSPVANASWSITMPALSSSTQVNFSVYGMSSSGTTLFFVYNTSSVNAYNTNVSGITLNLGNKTSP